MPACSQTTNTIQFGRRLLRPRARSGHARN
ncbi:hypothetical protein E2C01_090198 [Portunus trituberculatus]|uniref:Uncharacterized protein n=1 Tax=Portunus trituberculatus TaxID=210409 RepID=A0A5B7JL72_PORTR|nr:hypothetical protein [Portunus trituberculatus]